jgi:hypothetical protein
VKRLISTIGRLWSALCELDARTALRQLQPPSRK